MCLHLCVCACVHACVRAHVRMCVPKNRDLHQGQKIAKNTCIIGRACYVCTSVCVCACVHACVRTCVCAGLRTGIYTKARRLLKTPVNHMFSIFVL